LKAKPQDFSLSFSQIEDFTRGSRVTIMPWSETLLLQWEGGRGSSKKAIA
jgi:hypothetical protein